MIMKRTTILEIIIILNIILFLYTGIAKMQDYTVFREQMAESPVLAPVSKAIAFLLPLAEFVVVVLLAIPRWRLKGLYATLGLMILFTGYILALLATSDQLPCSCGGIIEQLSWQQHLVFNGVFILLNVLAIKLHLKEKKDLMKELNTISDYKILHG
jgi:uncharacterized membrane protein YphA (DoxX/SURF4 family)